ncbi:MAG: carbohydrate ABC transporter permease [Acetanaerobacterium sp.]
MKKQKSLVARRENYGYLFIAPFLVAFVFMQLLPMIVTFFYSLHNWDGIRPMIFIGVDNYIRLATDQLFWKTIYNTMAMWLMNVFFRMALALLCAVLLTRKRTKGTSVFRAIFYFPNLVTATTVATLFTFLVGVDNSTINMLLMNLGVLSQPIPFLREPILAQGVVATITLWMWFGYAMVFFISSILSISEDLYEAGTVDGTNAWQKFWHITFPSLRPSFAFVFISALIGGMQSFDIPMLVSQSDGRPARALFTMTMYMYEQAFKMRQTGYGSAVAYGLFLIIMLTSMMTYRIINNKSEENGGAR